MGMDEKWLSEDTDQMMPSMRASFGRHILFLCVHNAARSQMAEAIARELAPSHVRISSAGSMPTGVHPFALMALEEAGWPTDGLRSKHVDEIDSKTVDTVITLCAEQVCPIYLHECNRLSWPLPDPGEIVGDQALRAAFRSLRDEIERRIRELFTQEGW